eukprot:GFYU01003717.1.p1 GENE.GFYU01003717.1~~GFYU01003717.1.p1  ORF type:complete len:116 (-),score=14.06 GFYU01003717.1:280-582(-)
MAVKISLTIALLLCVLSVALAVDLYKQKSSGRYESGFGMRHGKADYEDGRHAKFQQASPEWSKTESGICVPKTLMGSQVCDRFHGSKQKCELNGCKWKTR